MQDALARLPPSCRAGPPHSACGAGREFVPTPLLHGFHHVTLAVVLRAAHSADMLSPSPTRAHVPARRAQPCGLHAWYHTSDVPPAHVHAVAAAPLNHHVRQTPAHTHP